MRPLLFLRDPNQPIESLFSLVCRLIRDAAHHTQTLMRSGADQHDAWNQTAVIHLQAAKVSSCQLKPRRACPLSGAGHCAKSSHSSSPPHRNCPPLTPKAVVQRVLIKGLISKTSCWQLLGRGNEAFLLDLLQVVQIAPPRQKNRSSLPLAPQAILGCLIQFSLSFVFVHTSPSVGKYLSMHSALVLNM